MDKKFNFSGWATRHNIKCTDGRTIIKDAFKDNDHQTVPLVWNHQHNIPENVLGHALLENRPEGVYAFCYFNDSEEANSAKIRVEHGDISSLSIYANQLKQQGANVIHGMIREVSLVLAGANPEAYIESVIKHGETSDEEAYIFSGENDNNIEIQHSETKKEEGGSTKTMDPEKKTEKTVSDVFNTLTEEQKTVVYALIGQAIEEAQKNTEDTIKQSAIDNNEGGNNMKKNVFDSTEGEQTEVLTHAQITAIITDAKKCGSFKDAVLQHGIENIDYLFPEAKNVTNVPTMISRDMGWVSKVMNSIHHTPFSRIKSMHANITEADARAKGYIKGNLKTEEVFGLLKRATTPTTIYKKQKLDRDDIIDIVDFDVVAFLKSEMRLMLDEEIARAALVGDGRLASSDDKINEGNIRPIWTDADLYTVKTKIDVAKGASSEAKAKAFITAAIKSRKNYKGSGSPSLYTTEDVLTDCLLIEDTTGRVIYDSVEKLATTLRVKEIITVPVMEDLSRTANSATLELMGIIVNLTDYFVGADKGGAVNMFDDFDIDYNAQKYLIETRCSGALTKPYSAIALELCEATT